MMKQCKVLDIKFHAFPYLLFFFKSTLLLFKDMASCGSLQWAVERKKNLHSRKAREVKRKGTVPNLECRKRERKREKITEKDENAWQHAWSCVGRRLVIVRFIHRDISKSSSSVFGGPKRRL